MKKIYIIIGTRPEIIKMSPVIPMLEKKFNVKIIFTGQHYSNILSLKIFSDLKITKPRYYFNSKSDSTAKQFPLMLNKIVDVLEKDRPNAVIVHGDTNTTLAGAIAANKLEIPVIHIESGARSGNKMEPEEVNRMLVDQIASINFPFNEDSLKCLKKENITDNVFNLPNTAREAVKRNISIAKKPSDILKVYQLEKNEFIISTLHRATNTNNVKNLKKYIFTIKEVSKNEKVVISLHPRTKKLLKEHDIKLPAAIIVIEPVGYLDFLMLIENAKCVISDSGGIVCESLVLNTPLFIFRNETERNDVVKMKKAKLLMPSWKNIEIKEFVMKEFSDSNLKRIKKIDARFEIDAAKKMVNIINRLVK